MFEYKPYNYLVVHKETNKFYYGCKYAKGGYTHPDLFWNTKHKKGYFTSSKTIHKMIDEYGHDAFEYKIIKVFDTAEETYLYEQKVIKSVINHKNCLNAACGGTIDKHKNRTKESYINACKKSAITNATKIGSDGLTNNQRSSKRYKNVPRPFDAVEKMKETKLTIGEDGLNSYERGGLKRRGVKLSQEHINKMKETKLIIGEDGLRSHERGGLKIKGDKNPSKKPENKKKISEGVKREWDSLSEEEKAIRRKKAADAMKRDDVRKKISDWQKDNNATRNTNWYNDGINSYRLKDDDSIITEKSLNQGRLSFKMQKKESTCPHCGLTGKGGNMKRYHFDMCKNKER